MASREVNLSPKGEKDGDHKELRGQTCTDCFVRHWAMWAWDSRLICLKLSMCLITFMAPDPESWTGHSFKDTHSRTLTLSGLPSPHNKSGGMSNPRISPLLLLLLTVEYCVHFSMTSQKVHGNISRYKIYSFSYL